MGRGLYVAHAPQAGNCKHTVFLLDPIGNHFMFKILL